MSDNLMTEDELALALILARLGSSVPTPSPMTEGRDSDEMSSLFRRALLLLHAELAEHFPVSVTARAVCADEAKMTDLREIIDAVGDASPDMKLTFLPRRLGGTYPWLTAKR